MKITLYEKLYMKITLPHFNTISELETIEIVFKDLTYILSFTDNLMLQILVVIVNRFQIHLNFFKSGISK